ncbi:YggT family protein [Metabacillus sp. 84]|uniref:YggT family protein n=1 Tax=unclassified Metabacillus TaxID=2675274 RepID=UPI003CF6AD5A
MSIVFTVLGYLLRFYSYAIIIYILMSWFPNARETKFGEILASICEPFLEPFRRIIPSFGMIDFSPIVAILVLNLAQGGLWSLYNMIS